MINQTIITECFKDLIGFEENDNPVIPDDLLNSESGLKVQQLHSLLTVENLLNCAQATGEEFIAYIGKRRDTAIIKLINAVYTAKQLNENSKELLSEVKMYEGVGNFNDKIVKLGRFVGYRLENLGKDLSLVLRTVGLQLDTQNPDFKLFVYHSSQMEPVAEIAIVHNKAISFTWFKFDKKILPSIEGGAYLIGYYEADLVGQAIKRQQYLTRRPQCSSCDRDNLALYSLWSKHLSIRPFYVNAGDLNEDKTKWNESAEIFIDGNNWGLNLALSVVCDPSGLFCRNRDIFSDALGKQIVVEFLNDIAFSMRDNQAKQKLSQMAFYSLKEGPDNATVQLEKAIKALNFSTSDLNKVCLPCQGEAFRLSHKSVY